MGIIVGSGSRSSAESVKKDRNGYVVAATETPVAVLAEESGEAVPRQEAPKPEVKQRASRARKPRK